MKMSSSTSDLPNCQLWLTGIATNLTLLVGSAENEHFRLLKRMLNYGFKLILRPTSFHNHHYYYEYLVVSPVQGELFIRTVQRFNTFKWKWNIYT